MHQKSGIGDLRILLTAGAAVLVLAGFYFYSHNAAVAPVENPAATETENELVFSSFIVEIKG